MDEYIIKKSNKMPINMDSIKTKKPDDYIEIQKLINKKFDLLRKDIIKEVYKILENIKDKETEKIKKWLKVI
jgi:hypothetical protein